MKVIIPMAGLGSRFKKQGYETIKPFIEWHAQTMIEHVMENLNYRNDSEFILILRKDMLDDYEQSLERIKQKFNVKFSWVEKLTEGPVCTILAAREHLSSDDMVLIANCVQIVDINVDDFVDDILSRDLDGGLLTFEDPEFSSKWSFVQSENGIVKEVKCKVPFTNEAVVGWYLYRRWDDFVNAALDLIINNDRANNEFFQCPTYNYAIKRGKNIGSYLVDFERMHGTGTPEDFESYLMKLKGDSHEDYN